MENIIKRLREELDKNNTYFKNEISTLAVGRATPMLVENVMVSYYGAPMPLKQIATISIPDARNILIKPWEKNQLKEIEKAINLAQLGFNPINDGETVRITIPQPTEERRKELVKHLRGIFEKARIAVRNIREEAIKEIRKKEKDGGVSEDEKFRRQEEIQKIIGEYNKKLEEEMAKKEKEIMTI